jgi:PIN domain nuclease of toxin-antitoxin system
MKLLLDTHVLLRLFARPAKIKKNVRERLADPANDVFVSAVSTWEIAIKVSIGKLALPGECREYVLERIEQAGLLPLSITPRHTLGVAALPAHHLDPFDRLLIAQAQAEGMTIVTSDRAFAKYDVETLPA